MDKKLIAQKLVEARGEEKQSVVANAIGISVSALSMYENGNRVPRDEIKVLLARHYKTTVEALFFTPKQHD